MKLHTDFHDYYDYAVGYGVDKNVHYNRFSDEAEIQIRTGYDFPDHSGAHLLGFCGQIYPFIKMEKFESNDDCYFDKYELLETFFAYSYEEYSNKSLEWDDFYGDFGGDGIKEKKFFLDWSYQSNDIFLKYKTPVWVLELHRNENIGIINPKLKDYDFERIKDPFTAFQDISMYLSNILVEQKETVIIEDKTKIEKHGFDKKQSFRKRKTN